MTLKDNQSFQAIIVGAGAAGLFCAAQLSQAGIKTLLLERNDRPGKKILISGGGRCNFTNLGVSPANYLSNNPHFFKSALSRYTADDFLALVKKYAIPFFEKKDGQLFCKTSSKEIVELLLSEIKNSKVTQIYDCQIESLKQSADGFELWTNRGNFKTGNVIVASGGLSFPQLGATHFGYRLAKQFDLGIIETQAALVPFEGDARFKKTFGTLSGLSFRGSVSIKKTVFTDDILITHLGLSGPAILQISNYWNEGDSLAINLLPGLDIQAQLVQAKESGQKQRLDNFLSHHLPERFVEILLKDQKIDSKPLNELSDKTIRQLSETLVRWVIKPLGSLGYGKAEVTRGGVDTNELSSKTMESKKIPGLYFIGEVVDVTGWLGGFNFQWAWASAYAASQALIEKSPSNKA